MRSPDKKRVALLAAYAIALHGFERLVPSPVPWLRFGLANIITLTALVLYGFRPAMTITLIRVTVGSFLTGTFLGPAFILSLGSGVVSTAAMALCLRVSGRLFGPVGISLIGALFHNLTQLLLAYALFIQRFELVVIVLPVIVLVGTITGALNGIVSSLLIDGITRGRTGPGDEGTTSGTEGREAG